MSWSVRNTFGASSRRTIKPNTASAAQTPNPTPWPIAHTMPCFLPPSMVLRRTTIKLGPGETAPRKKTVPAAMRMSHSTTDMAEPIGGQSSTYWVSYLAHRRQRVNPMPASFDLSKSEQFRLHLMRDSFIRFLRITWSQALLNARDASVAPFVCSMLTHQHLPTLMFFYVHHWSNRAGMRK